MGINEPESVQRTVGRCKTVGGRFDTHPEAAV